MRASVDSSVSVRSMVDCERVLRWDMASPWGSTRIGGGRGRARRDVGVGESTVSCGMAVGVMAYWWSWARARLGGSFGRIGARAVGGPSIDRVGSGSVGDVFESGMMEGES